MKIKSVILIILIYGTARYFLYYLGNKHANRLVFYDIGQGDSILLSTKNNERMLIDGGPGFEISNLLSNEFILNKCYLDYVLLTHPHADHLKGLTRVISNCVIGTLLFNPITYDSKLYSDFLLQTKKQRRLEPYKGNILSLGQFKLYVFWPESDSLANIDNVNNISTVLLLDYGSFEALFTGDLERDNLAKLNYEKMQSLIQNGLDVLKVPHHGSRDSLQEVLYTKLLPKVCIISVGQNNRYGHPDKEVLNFLNKIKCEVRRTDLDGTIEILID